MATEIIDRAAWEAMLDRLDGDTQETLRAELAAWVGGDACDQIEVRTDSLGRLDSMSSPRPAAIASRSE